MQPISFTQKPLREREDQCCFAYTINNTRANASAGQVKVVLSAMALPAEASQYSHCLDIDLNTSIPMLNRPNLRPNITHPAFRLHLQLSQIAKFDIQYKHILSLLKLP